LGNGRIFRCAQKTFLAKADVNIFFSPWSGFDPTTQTSSVWLSLVGRIKSDHGESIKF
jgi:hypothetical protein